MKNIVFIFCLILSPYLFSQTNPTDPTISGTNSNVNFWSKNGNDNSGLGNIFGVNAGNNNSIWYRTNGLNRMVIGQGGGTGADGYIGIGASLPGTFIPQARLHVTERSAAGRDLLLQGTKQ